MQDRPLTGRGAVLASAVLALLAGVSRGAAFTRWEAAHEGLLGGGDRRIAALAAGGSPLVVCAIAEPGGLYVSTDSGRSWAKVEGRASHITAPCTVAVAPDNGKVIFAAASAPGAGLWRTKDGGHTWAKVGDKAKGMASDDVEWITLSAQHPKLILVGHRAGKAISASPDGGETWLARSLGSDLRAQRPFIVTDTRWLVASREDAGAMFYTEDSGNTWHRSTGKVATFPGPLPVIQAGEYLFSSSHHGTNKSTDGGRTWSYAMERHARVIGTLGTRLVREDRAPIRGTNTRILTVAISSDYANSWQDVTGSLIDLIPVDKRPLVTIDNNVDPYAHVRFATAWAASPDGRTGFLGLGKAGLYGMSVMSSKGGPILGGARVAPPSVLEGEKQALVAVGVSAAAKFGKLGRVFADLSSLGLGDLPLLDDGKHEDGDFGDRFYGNTFRVPGGVEAGMKVIGLVAEDDAGRVNSVVARLKVASASERMIVWDGDTFAHGHGWAAPQEPFIYLKSQTEEAHSGKVALEFHGDGAGWMGGGWNWHGWYPENAGTDISGFRNLVLWAKAVGDDPGGIELLLHCSAGKKQTGKVSVQGYCPDLNDGQWHEIVIPLADLYHGVAGYDPRKTWQFDLNIWAPKERRFSLYIDDIGFDNRRSRPHSVWVRLPEERGPAAVAADAAQVIATVDTRAQGTPISPWIYGASLANRELAKEMGLTIIRAGGNPVTPHNWKKGFGSKGSDWFYQNDGTEVQPEKDWLVTFHQENAKHGFQTYLTVPMMGRVAKDGSSVAFDTRKHPDQTDWAGKSQPTDPLPHAGSGVQVVRDAKGQLIVDENGKRTTRLVQPDPDETSVAMSPEEQTAMLRFIIETLGCGTADKGGVRFVALDNEPALWHATHRGMRPQGCSYDELWDRTRTYATLLKRIDPKVEIAVGTFFGWTAYFYSGRDMQLVHGGKGTWDDPPDHVAHGRVPITKWLLRKLADHERKTGQRLADVLDWHFYPQTGIYMAGKRNDPKTMQHRVEETRVLWDPTWKDPSWMGKETGKVVQLIRLMKQWVAECYPGLKTSVGEYNFGGDGDMSGGIAQAELLGVFAREGLDHAYYWLCPAPNSPSYFAFKLYRNPDGRHTAFGGRYLPVKASAPHDVSVHAARDMKTGRLTFVVINKRVAKEARLTLTLSQPVPEQDVALFEFSGRDHFAIGQLPRRKVSGKAITLDLPAFSALRFDLKP